jgi:D-alanine-D-alanine ligase
VPKKKLRVGFTYDAKADYTLQPGDKPDKFAEFDSEKTLSEIAGAIASAGHEVVRIGHVRNLNDRLVKGERWDIVFNIAEGLEGRNRESQVPMLLELYGIPYTGSDALTLGVALDKAVAKMVISHHGLATPKFLEVSSMDDLKNFNLRFPVFVKPSEEGTSKGIEAAAICRDFESMKKRAQHVLDTYCQPALVEEFVSGQEFTVAVIGNEEPLVLPPVQVAIKGNINLGDDFYTHERVENDEIRYLCPAPAPAAPAPACGADGWRLRGRWPRTRGTRPSSASPRPCTGPRRRA